MNHQNPPMMAYELAMHQRVQEQAQQGAHAFHRPPNQLNQKWQAHGQQRQLQQQQQHHMPRRPHQQQQQQPPPPQRQQQQQHSPWGMSGPGNRTPVVGQQQQQQQQPWNGPQQPRPLHPQQQQQRHSAPAAGPWAPAPNQAPPPTSSGNFQGRGPRPGANWGGAMQQQQQCTFGPPGSRSGPPSGAPRGPTVGVAGVQQGLRVGNSNGPNWQQQQAGRPNIGNHTNNSSGNGYNQGRVAGSWGHNKSPNANGSSQQGFSSPAAAAAAAAAAGGRSATGRPPVQTPQSSPLTPPVAVSSSRPVSQQKSVAAIAAASAAASTGVRGGGTTTTAKTVLSCEPCEKDFTSEVARQAHLQSHVPCPEKGCGFSALRKVVNNHHEAKHGQFSGSGFQTIEVEGTKFRVLLGTSPEEVELWRAERRKRWPTEKNKARKEEDDKKRRALGDLGPDPGPAGRGRGRGRGRGGGRERGGRGRGRGAVDRSSVVLTTAAASSASASAGAGQGGGEGVILGDDGGDEAAPGTAKRARDGKSEEDVAPSKVARVVVDEVNAAGAGAGAAEGGAAVNRRLCTFYLKGRCDKGQECTFSHDVERKNCSYFMSGRCHKGKGCLFMHDHEARNKARLEAGDSADGTPAKPAKTDPKAKQKAAAAAAVAAAASKPTLLRKLLAPQLHRESSIALQAIRFIVQSKFFMDAGAGAGAGAETDADTIVARSTTPAATAGEADAIAGGAGGAIAGGGADGGDGGYAAGSANAGALAGAGAGADAGALAGADAAANGDAA